MNSGVWPLVFFTLLSQLSMGMVLAGAIGYLFIRSDGPVLSHELKQAVVLVALVSLALALVLAFLHLARPLHSVHALGNLGSSHLSREILMVCVFLFFLFLGWLSLRFGSFPQRMFGYAYLLALVSGLLLVWVMGRLYMIPTVPLWNSPVTLVKFYNSGVVLGAGALLVLLSLLQGKGMDYPWAGQAARVLFILVAAGVAVHLLVALLPSAAGEGTGAGFPLPVIPAAWRIAALLMLGMGFLLLSWWLFGRMHERVQWPVFVSFGMLLLAEIFFRYIFYLSYFRTGV